jgi:hypothetical protein
VDEQRTSTEPIPDGPGRDGDRGRDAQLAEGPELGGDAACWAHRVCPECGRLNAAEHPVVCEACGARFE